MHILAGNNTASVLPDHVHFKSGGESFQVFCEHKWIEMGIHHEATGNQTPRDVLELTREPRENTFIDSFSCILFNLSTTAIIADYLAEDIKSIVKS